MTITRYTADQLQRSANGDLVAYDDWLNEYTARRSVLRYLANLQNRYADAKAQIESLQQDVEELEERLRSK